MKKTLDIKHTILCYFMYKENKNACTLCLESCKDPFTKFNSIFPIIQRLLFSGSKKKVIICDLMTKVQISADQYESANSYQNRPNSDT